MRIGRCGQAGTRNFGQSAPYTTSLNQRQKWAPEAAQRSGAEPTGENQKVIARRLAYTETKYKSQRVRQPLWRRHRMLLGKAEMLPRGSAVVVKETNNGPAREAALLLLVSAAGPFCAYLNKGRYMSWVWDIVCRRVALRSVGSLHNLKTRQQKRASGAATRRGAESTGANQHVIARRSVCINRNKIQTTAGMAAAVAELRDDFGKAEVLVRGSPKSLEETNDGPARDAAMAPVVSAEGPAILRFP